MTESLCSCCKLFGKPPARINFIFATGLPYSLMYRRIKYILGNYSENSVFEHEARLADYEALMDTSNQIFIGQNKSPSIEQSTSAVTETCSCHGFTIEQIMCTDTKDSAQLDAFQKRILDILDPEDEEKNSKRKTPTWIMISDSRFLESAVLNVFVQIHNQRSSLLSFTLTLFCFVVNEAQLFENFVCQDLPVEDYQSKIYADHESRINKFFVFLEESEYLQENTLLLNEKDLATDDDLQILLQDIFRSVSSKYRANNNRHRFAMSTLLTHRERTIDHVKILRKELLKFLKPTIENRLVPLLNKLKQQTTAAPAARQITHLVLDEFKRMNKEEKRIYQRQLTLGFEGNDAEDSSTITAQLIHYALYLLRNDNGTSMSLVYSITLTISKLGEHINFRHKLFQNTPEIYDLSLLLISKRHYALTLCGLRLCVTILNGDEVEHKYALAYLKHDAKGARKIIDAIKWLLSPYITLKNLWREEEEKITNDNSE